MWPKVLTHVASLSLLPPPRVQMHVSKSLMQPNFYNVQKKHPGASHITKRPPLRETSHWGCQKTTEHTHTRAQFLGCILPVVYHHWLFFFFAPNDENNRSFVMKVSENRKFLRTNCTCKVHSTLLRACVCFHNSVWLEITRDLNVDILPPERNLSSPFAPLKTLNLHCGSAVNAARSWNSCVSTNRRRKGRKSGRGNRFSRPGRAVGKEGSCRGNTEMSQDIPLWLHSAGQIQTFL